MSHEELIKISAREAFDKVFNNEWSQDEFVDWHEAVVLKAEKDAIYYTNL
jgi:hypothetical protein